MLGTVAVARCALFFADPYTRAGDIACPASHTDGWGPTWAYLGDSSGPLAFSAEPNLDRGYDAWSLAGVTGPDPSLADLPWSSFRVLQLQLC